MLPYFGINNRRITALEHAAICEMYELEWYLDLPELDIEQDGLPVAEIIRLVGGTDNFLKDYKNRELKVDARSFFESVEKARGKLSLEMIDAHRVMRGDSSTDSRRAYKPNFTEKLKQCWNVLIKG